MLTKPKWIETNDFLIVTYPGNSPVQIRQGNAKYLRAKELLSKERFDELFKFLFGKAKRISDATKGLFRIDVVTGQVFIGNEELPKVLAKKLLGLYDSNAPYEPLIRFWEKLKKNPDERIRQQLYGFLQASHIPLTPDGSFLAYKAVNNINGHLWDKYTGKIRHDIGDHPKMPREEVDSNPNRTCSHGLHVASHHYAKYEYGGDVVIEIKVSPEHVCAVPTDYSNQKMRVCKYEVVSLNKSPIVDEWLAPSVLRIKKKLSKQKLEEQQSQVDKTPVSLGSLTAQGIIDTVQARTGIKITLDLKNKKAILKKALEVFRQYKILRAVVFKEKSARELVELVKAELGIDLGVSSFKDKQSILNKSRKLFQGYGFRIKE